MTKKLTFLVIGVLLMACESSLFSFFPIELAKPDIGVPYIIYATFFLSPAQGLLAAVVFGFFQELLTTGPSGAMLFTDVALLLSCMFLRSRLYIESRYIFSLVCAASVLGQSLLFLALSFLAKGETRNIFNVLVYSVPDAIVTGFVSLLFFALFEQFHVRYAGRV
jgi:rod shape-determining protein MreD